MILWSWLDVYLSFFWFLICHQSGTEKKAGLTLYDETPPVAESKPKPDESVKRKAEGNGHSAEKKQKVSGTIQ